MPTWRWKDLSGAERISLIIGEDFEVWKTYSVGELTERLSVRAFSEAGLVIEQCPHAGKLDDYYTTVLTNNARLVAHELLMLIWGLAPSLPALIHLELASIKKKEKEKNAQGNTGDAVNAWRKWIRAFRRFVFKYRIANEIWCLTEENKLVAPERFQDMFIAPLSPDVSHNTFGLDGKEGLLIKLINYKRHLEELRKNGKISKQREKEIKKIINKITKLDSGGEGKDSRKYRHDKTKQKKKIQKQKAPSLFEDVERKLFLAEGYLTWIENELKLPHKETTTNA